MLAVMKLGAVILPAPAALGPAELADRITRGADKREKPIFPRWFGYFNFWIGIMFIPGELIWFFKTGPFAWNGLVSFWFVVAAFSVWMVLMTYYTAKAIRNQPEQEWTEIDPVDVAALASQVAALTEAVARLSGQQATGTVPTN
jgi:hypothetical protein